VFIATIFVQKLRKAVNRSYLLDFNTVEAISRPAFSETLPL
jgi:hypothetical protein